MNPYTLIKPLLFCLDAELAHNLTLKFLKLLHRLGLLCLICPKPISNASFSLWGLTFPNRVGLAAGLDKNGAYIDALAALGFGFIEIGTITPRPQPGNPKPRLFRLPKAQAIINRFGFNNAGVDALVENVKKAKYQGILGINIGKNFDTPNERAIEDYVHCMRKVYAYASYITVNISSPNTKNLRDLQEKEALTALLATLKAEQTALAQTHQKYVPILLKIAPDLSPSQVDEIAQLLIVHQFDGVIATNTTLARDAVQDLKHAEEAGGLSGAPVREKSTAVIAQLHRALQGQIPTQTQTQVPIIGVGGILSNQDAQEKLNAGASLVQVYSGLIYQGPALISALVR